MGLQGSSFPDCGGSGFSYVELIVSSRMGRSLCARRTSRRSSSREHADAQWRRRGEETASAGHRVGRHPRRPRVHRGQRSVDESGITMSLRSRRFMDAQRPQDVRARRPCRESHRGRRRTGKGVSLFTVDADARASRVRRCRRWTRRASKPDSSSTTRPRRCWAPMGRVEGARARARSRGGCAAAEQVGGARSVST